MKTVFLIIPLLVLTTLTSFAQKTNDLVSLRLGYSSANVVFKEAFEPSINIFGTIFNTGHTFVGDGPELGISKDINNKISLDLSFSTFSGKDTKARLNNNENFYTLKGFQTSLSANYFLRENTKRLRINIGAGFQYIKAHLQQFETISLVSGQTTNQITGINISELQLSIRPGVQFRILSNLFASFIVKVSISTKGRYSDNPCLSLKYTFKKKR